MTRLHDNQLSQRTPTAVEVIGSLVDQRYRIESLLGEGGMGVVVLATDRKLNRKVAIKLLHQEYADQPEVLERFALEARAIAKLRSQHVVQVLDVSTNPARPYLVLEHLEGESLEERIFRSGPLPFQEAVRYTREIAEALEEAHSVGILHRDIKPANVFLARQPNHELVAKLLDFGTARFFEAKLAGQRSKPTITKQSETFGSPAYMPPEQISSARNTDERSDVWALGTVLYEAITGKIAFEGEYPDVFVAISTREPVPLSTARPEAPPELQAVIERCLRKSREERYNSMTELKRALQALEREVLPSKSGGPIGNTIPSPPLMANDPLTMVRLMPPPSLEPLDVLVLEPTRPPLGSEESIVQQRSRAWLWLLAAAPLLLLLVWSGRHWLASSDATLPAATPPEPSAGETGADTSPNSNENADLTPILELPDDPPVQGRKKPGGAQVANQTSSQGPAPSPAPKNQASGPSDPGLGEFGRRK